MLDIQKLALPTPGLERLLAEASAEGIRFIQRLHDEWTSGENRFDGPGEGLWGRCQNGVLVGLGGVNRDPFAGDEHAGRIRRVYVRPAWRGSGVGSSLVAHLIEQAKKAFQRVYLRSENPAASRLYERLGFESCDEPFATHILRFEAGARSSLSSGEDMTLY